MGRAKFSVETSASTGWPMMLATTVEIGAPTPSRSRHVAGWLTASRLVYPTKLIAKPATQLHMARAAPPMLTITRMRRRIRVMVSIGGAALAIWSCVAGLAISFVGYTNLLAVNHPATWRDLEGVGAPISTVVASIIGHPVLAEVSTLNLARPIVSYTSFEIGPAAFWLSPGEQAKVTVVSPSNRQSALIGDFSSGAALVPGAAYGMQISGTTEASHIVELPANKAVVKIPIHLQRGINIFTLTAFG